MRNIHTLDYDIELLLRKGEILVQQFQSCVESMLINYTSALTEVEILTLKDVLGKIKFYFTHSFSQPQEKVEYLKTLLPLEESLKPLVIKCWNSEEDIHIISWLKDDHYRKKERTISASLASSKDFHVFCESSIGISYKITLESFLGALPQDAAVVIHQKEPTFYTILSTEEYTVESYSLATTLITPYEILENVQKYCEIILDARYAVAESVIYFREDDFDMAESLSQQLHLPVENLNQKEKK